MNFHKILFLESKFIILGLLLKYVLMDYFLPRQDVSWNLSKMLLILYWNLLLILLDNYVIFKIYRWQELNMLLLYVDDIWGF